MDFFHDFSSPFSYLASTQIARIAKAHGAKLRYRPILLGALFKAIGTPNVPLFEMNPARQAYQKRDLFDWAKWWEVDFRFPETFPLRTVAPLRVALQAPECTPILYRAAWAEGINIGDPDALVALLDRAPESLLHLLVSYQLCVWWRAETRRQTAGEGEIQEES